MTQQRTAAVSVDDLAVLLPDWRTHLRAHNIAPSTIASYLKVGDNLLTWDQSRDADQRVRDRPRAPGSVPGGPVGPVDGVSDLLALLEQRHRRIGELTTVDR